MRTNGCWVGVGLLAFLTGCSGDGSQGELQASSTSELAVLEPACRPTFVVTTTSDRADVCHVGNCSLREAVMAANGCAGFNTIEVPAGDFELTLGGGEPDPPGPGSDRRNDLDILEPVRLVGAAKGGTVLRSSVPGFFQIYYPGDSPETVLENLTLNGTGQDARGIRIGDAEQTSHPRVAVQGCHFHSFGAGAIEASLGSLLRVSDSNFTSNFAAQGGAILARTDELDVSSSQFFANTSWQGGALWVYSPTVARIRKSTFESNAVSSGPNGTAFGGAIYSEARLEVLDSSFSSNKSHGGAGAILATKALTVERSTFVKNQTQASGGALFTGVGDLTIVDCLFSHNTAVGHGGVLSAWGTSYVHIRTSEFDFNEAYYGGALQVAYALDVERASFVGNRAKFGGAIYDTSFAKIANATFSRNYAREGGAIYVPHNRLQLKSSTLFGNESDKGVLLAAGTGKIELTHSIVSNDPAGVGAAQLCTVSGSSATIQSLGHNFFQGESCPLLPSLDVSGPDPKLRALELRPASSSVELASHHPEDGSPAADHGSTTASSGFGDDTCAALDVWGRSRPVRALDIPWSPPRCDIGAVEIHPELP
jgi:CSLREA domain-containing protein